MNPLPVRHLFAASFVGLLAVGCDSGGGPSVATPPPGVGASADSKADAKLKPAAEAPAFKKIGE